MNCVKCNAETNGDIFCNNCSDEILKLYLVDKIPADEIEKRFNLLPNTVEFWSNHCKVEQPETLNVSDTINKNKATFSNIVFTFVVFAIINSLMFPIYGILSIASIYFIPMLKIPFIVGYLSLGLIYLILTAIHYIFKKLKFNKIYLPFYKRLKIILIIIMGISYTTTYSSYAEIVEEQKLGNYYIVGKRDNIDYTSQVSNEIIENQTPIYTLNKKNENTINLYDIDNQVYFSYLNDIGEIVVFPLNAIDEVDVHVHYPSMFTVKNDINEFNMYSDIYYDEAILTISGRNDYYVLSDFFEYENFEGEIVKVYNVTDEILKDLKKKFSVEYLNGNDAERVSENIPYHTLEKASSQGFAVFKLPELELSDSEYYLSNIRKTNDNKSYGAGLGRTVEELKEDGFTYTVDDVIYIDISKYLGSSLTEGRNDVEYYFLATKYNQKLLRCSNIIVITKEDYENKIW